MGKFTEAEYEKAIMELFEEQGYGCLHGEEIHRKSDEIFLEDDLRQFISSRYGDLNQYEIDIVVSRIKNISKPSLYQSNREAFWLINEGFDMERAAIEKPNIHIDYMDFDNVENNIFKVVNQYSVECSGQTRIPDILVFVNGIPVAIWELKSVIEEDVTIHDAWEQITIRYTRDIPNLLKYCFLSVISDGANTKMGSIFTPYKNYYAWNRVEDDDDDVEEMESLYTMIRGAFSRERLLAILRDFVFYPDDSNEDEVIVCQYPQFFAANKMFESLRRSVLSGEEGRGKGGTYFGTTGCGKTYAMLFLSRLITLRDNNTFHNPTIVVIVDREDLDEQTSKKFVVAKRFLRAGENDVRSIETRKDLSDTLSIRKSGGVYITTIQKFSEETGLLSDRSNIICISDEAHRTQTGIGAKMSSKGEEVIIKYGFAKYLRDSFPNASYCGFTGTPIDETVAVFGDVVDKYTMKEAVNDGITVSIAYEPRLARVMLSEEETRKIEEYYRKCADEGSTVEQVNASKEAMSKLEVILSNPKRINKMAADIVSHYEAMCVEKPNVVQKAMIVCIDRQTALNVLKAVLAIRPEWGEARKAENEAILDEATLNKLVAMPKINLVASQRVNDEKELYEKCGNKEYHKKLADQFKNDKSNFRIAIVVDMWTTGFDVACLAVMYIDKPLQRHTLIQTISRVNRPYEGKDKGLIVDYFGFKEEMEKALKQYGSDAGSPVEEIKETLAVFRNHLDMIDGIFTGFNAADFFMGEPTEKYSCLVRAVEFVQMSKEVLDRFMKLSRTLKEAYDICCHTGELTELEEQKALFYKAVRSIIYKQTKGSAPDAETMNKKVEEMVAKAISCTGVENIIDADKSIDIFNEEFIKSLEKVKLPITKFNALIKHLKKVISEYGRTNRLKAIDFSERLKEVVNKYNNRDHLMFSSEELYEFVNGLSDEIMEICRDLKEDKLSFEKMGISFEEKAFYDILVRVRDEHEFEYPDDKCVELAKEIKTLIDDNSQYVDWSVRDQIKNKLMSDLIVLLVKNGYPPVWKEEVFKKVLSQAENFKKFSE